MTEQIKIKRTTIERGVRLAHGDDDYSVAPVKALAVAAIKQKRDQEKQVLHQLNDRFAKYIDRVKFLEAQNKKLLAELEELRQRWGEESRLIRERYEPELLEARATIDDTTREKAISEIRAKRSEYEAANFKRQYDDALNLIQADKNKMANLEYLMQENQVELDLLRRQMHDAESDIDKYKKEVLRLNEDLQRLLSDLDQETLKRVKLENEKQTLEEQIPFLNAIHEQEMAELRSLQASSHVDPAQFYRHELERAIRDIRSDFEDLSHQQKRDLEEWYKIKTEEIVHKIQKADTFDSAAMMDSFENLKVTFNDNHKEYSDLKQLNMSLVMRLGQLEEDLDQRRRKNAYDLDQHDREIYDLRNKLQEATLDYDDLLNSKASLEFEISTYRRLLESEESRKEIPDGAFNRYQYQPASRTAQNYYQSNTYNNSQNSYGRQNAPSTAQNYTVFNTQPVRPPPTVTVKNINLNELSTKTTFHRNAKGPMSISECSPDGKVIILENTSRNKDVDLTNWLLLRRVDSNEEIKYQFPNHLILKANHILKVWARGYGKERYPNELVNEGIDNWGMGSNIVTIILNENQEEKARHMQTTVYPEI